MKKLSERMPDRAKRAKIIVQARVDKGLHDQVDRVLKKNQSTWQDLIEAALKQYLDEQRGTSC